MSDLTAHRLVPPALPKRLTLAQWIGLQGDAEVGDHLTTYFVSARLVTTDADPIGRLVDEPDVLGFVADIEAGEDVEIVGTEAECRAACLALMQRCRESEEHAARAEWRDELRAAGGDYRRTASYADDCRSERGL